MGALSTACVDPTPTYTAPVQSPPIILGNLVDPPTVRVRTVPMTSQPTVVHLVVPFRSTDGGEKLVAIFWQDYDPSKSQSEINLHQFIKSLGDIRDDARPLDEQLDRNVASDWTAIAGCHTVTMALSHESNYPIDKEHGNFTPGLLPPNDQNDIGQVTWFFDVQDPSVEPSARQICWGNQ